MNSKSTNTHIFQYIKKETKLYHLFIQKLQYDWSFALSGMIAFCLLMTILSMALVLFIISCLILDNNASLKNKLKVHIAEQYPLKLNDSLNELMNIKLKILPHNIFIILTLGLLFSIIGCVGLCRTLDQSLAIIYRLDEGKFSKKHFIIILLLIFIPSILTASFIPTTLIDTVFNLADCFTIYMLGFFLSLSLTFTLFELIYFVIPNKKMTIRRTWCGAFVAAIAIQLFIILVPLYTRHYMTSYIGHIGFVIIVILLLFYFSMIIILGAQINAFFFECIQPLPASLGTLISKYMDDFQEDMC